MGFIRENFKTDVFTFWVPLYRSGLFLRKQSPINLYFCLFKDPFGLSNVKFGESGAFFSIHQVLPPTGYILPANLPIFDHIRQEFSYKKAICPITAINI